MPFTRYSVTLFDPIPETVDLGSIPEGFTAEYFVEKLQEKWPHSTIHYPSSDNNLNWFVPDLDSGDPDNDFAGTLNFQDKSIVFGLTPHKTILEFIRWVASIIPSGSSIYLLKLVEVVILKITPFTKDEEILDFLVQQ